MLARFVLFKTVNQSLDEQLEQLEKTVRVAGEERIPERECDYSIKTRRFLSLS